MITKNTDPGDESNDQDNDPAFKKPRFEEYFPSLLTDDRHGRYLYYE